MYRNPWDYGWRSALMWWGLAAILATSLYFLKVRPKLEVCRVYYSDMDTFSCFMSAYGLPARGAKMGGGNP